ncbi:MAG: apolipoprotein N-acyltransferase, partial [Gammaproteobacteria bacterium]|nr:apolipoprotein N-acyltransferase [Gammaproteobacteria bacterium]
TAAAPLNTISRNYPVIRMCVALILGSLLPLAFAPFSIWPLAILIPALMLGVVQSGLSTRKLFFAGWIFGIGYFGFGVYWIYNSLHDFGMAPPVVAGGITGLLIIYLALAPALVFTIWSHAKRRIGEISLWLLPLLWFGLEWFKGWFLTGMPWLSLGYSQTDSPLSGFAPLIGVYGISALCLFMSVALFLLLRDKRYSMLGILIAIPVSGWLLQQVEWTEPLAKPLKVTMVQGNIPQEVKWRRDQRQNIFNTYWRETNQFWDSDLIIWPETALPGNSEEIEQSVLQPMQKTLIEQGTMIISGLVGSDKGSDRYYNSAVLLGAERVWYHKRHLVIFGEYYPMRWLLSMFSGLINIPYSDLTPGPRQQKPMVVDGSTLGLSICFEDVFSRDIMLSLPAANLLINLSNDAWFGDSTAPHQHMQIAQMRSLETERVMMRSTNTGISAFIDHNGRMITQTSQFVTESINASVTGRTGVTPFYYFAIAQGPISFLILISTLLLSTTKGQQLISRWRIKSQN